MTTTAICAPASTALLEMRRMDFRPLVRQLAAHLRYTLSLEESRDTIWAFLYDGSECKQMLVWRSA